MFERCKGAWQGFRNPKLLSQRGLVGKRKPGVRRRIRRMLSLLKAWPLIVGVGLLLLSLALERIELLSPNPQPIHAIEAQSIINFHNVILIVSELGYAFVIAWVVSLAIEAGARAEQNHSVEEAIGRISRDVFEGALSIKHDKDYIKSVVETCLDQPLVRDLFRIHYRIEPFPPEHEAALGLDPGRFVLIHVKIAYTVRNVGRHEENFRITYGIPCRSGELRAFSKVTSLNIGDEQYATEPAIAPYELGANQVEGEHGLTSNDRNYRFSVDLVPSESIDIAITADLVKEMSDSDTFGFRRPTSGADIQISNSVPRLKFGVQGRTSGNLRVVSDADGFNGEWKIDGPILPYQSVNLWWRSPADDGETDSSSGEADNGKRSVLPNVVETVRSGKVHRGVGTRLGRIFAKEEADEP